ncbi:MAG: exodeoxyribonuclease V subunit alpha [Mycobacterium sp.]
MTVVEFDDPCDRRLVARAGGLLHTFNCAGVLDAADVHVARRLTALAREDDETVALAVALAVRAVRGGSVCVDLTDVAESVGVERLPWPDTQQWLAAVRASPLLGTPPVLRMFGDRLLYLDRYWREEEQVCADLLASTSAPVVIDDAVRDAGPERVFPLPGYDDQRAAARIALSQWTTVLTGGPGTGKTTTVAGLLALLAEQAERVGQAHPRIALAAPTGKAAARLEEAVRYEIAKLAPSDQARLSGLRAVTLHLLLGWRRGSSARFRHNRNNRLPYDVIVVDETSMVSLTLMARLLEAVRPHTRLILVGDPDQLTSVEAGAVLADLVDGLGARTDTRIATLRISHRFGESIGRLAEAIRTGDGDTVMDLLRGGGEHIEFVEAADPTEALREICLPAALSVHKAAAEGDAAGALGRLDDHRLLCAHREGPYGIRHWNRQIQRWLSEETGEPTWSQWYLGRPVLVTTNDYGLGLHNGDAGVAILRAGGLRAVIATSEAPREFATSRLSDVETMHALTIHKSQGSQATDVTVLLPPVESRLLSRELLYTAVTRAKAKVRVVGSEGDVRAALDRRALRATGLRLRLAGDAK